MFEFVRQNILALTLTALSAASGVIVILADRDSSLWVGVGGSLLAAAFVSFLDFAKKIQDEGFDKRRQALRQAGLLMVHSDRNIPEYKKLVAKAARIDVCGYSLTSFTGQHSAVIKARAARGEVEVRILLVDPASQASLDQAAAEAAAGGSFAYPVQKVIAEFTGQPRIQIRFISTALPTMVFRMDKRVFVGPHFARASTTVATLELDEGWMSEQYTGVFDTLWASATPVS